MDKGAESRKRELELQALLNAEVNERLRHEEAKQESEKRKANNERIIADIISDRRQKGERISAGRQWRYAGYFIPFLLLVGLVLLMAVVLRTG